ncbi:MAG: MFS transporter [Acidobacteria bacterium]|nr:MFS transporter [Acidobacteriota bacterium]
MAMTERRRVTTALLVYRALSAAASVGTVTALGKQVYDIGHRQLDLGLLGLAEFAPAALLILVTGTVADRYPRRLIGATATAAQAVAVVAIGWYASTDPTSIGPIFVIVVCFGVGRAFAAPSTRSLPADLVPADRLPRFIPRMSGAFQVASIAGPVIAGVLYAVDPAAAFLAQALLLAAATFVLLQLPASPNRPVEVTIAPELEAAVEPLDAHESAVPVPRATLSQALDGLRFVRQQPILLGAISLDLFAVLFGGAVALLPAIAEDRLGVGSVGFGWLRAATGIGSAIVTAFLAFRPVRRRVGRVLLVAVAVFGVFTVVLGLTHTYVIAFLALAVLSGADSISVFIRSTLVPLATPDHMRGRVMAVENVFVGASNELGAFESGVAGQLIGTGGAVVLGGAATLVVAGTWWALFPHLREVDGFPGTTLAIDERGTVVE